MALKFDSAIQVQPTREMNYLPQYMQRLLTLKVEIILNQAQ